jgi:integrase/recombinase XerD
MEGSKHGRAKEAGAAAFYGFALSNKWVEDNLAKQLKRPRIEARETLPYEKEEMLRILTAAESRIAECQAHGRDNARRLKALIYLLRYSGLRIGDAVGCDTKRLVGGNLRLYTQKSGTHVHLPLPPFVVKELDSIPKSSERYWFWTGNGKLQTAVADWQGRLLELGKDAKITRLHAHRFRDTFAVQLLLAGNSLETVSKLLGHSSIKVTEKHYAPWVRERQEHAEASVRVSWSRDPVVLMQEETGLAKTNDTPLIHGKQGLAN